MYWSRLLLNIAITAKNRLSSFLAASTICIVKEIGADVYNFLSKL